MTVNKWNDKKKEWTERSATEVKIKVTHTVGDLKSDTKYKVYVNNELYNSYQSDSNGTIVFDYTGNLRSTPIFSIK
ncbi:hypothetical protein ES703_42234 [subsurface metagenome]